MNRKLQHSVVVPKIGTTACRDFYDSWSRINSFLSFVLYLVNRIEANAHIAHDTLLTVERDPMKRKEMEVEWARRVSTADELKNHRQIFMEIILVRHVENYLGYLSLLLYEIFNQRPETLRSSDKVDLSLVLSHDSIEGLVKSIAERKVEELSYQSFNQLGEFFKERFNIQLLKESEIEQMVEVIETRNISVHNRCIINKRYLKRTNGDPALLGKRKELFIGQIESLIESLATSVRNVDATARKRLRLKGVRFQID
jgi:hypothetical protein